MKKLLFSVTLFTAMITATALTQGCMPALLSGAIATGVKEMRIQDQEDYRRYVIKMEKINLKREKAKLKTRPILTYKEWTKAERPHAAQEEPKVIPCIFTAY